MLSAATVQTDVQSCISCKIARRYTCSVGNRQPAWSQARCQALGYNVRHSLNGDHGVDACIGTKPSSVSSLGKRVSRQQP